MKRLRILLLSTEYSHWSAYSGYTGFISHLNTDRFEATLIKTPMGSELFPGWLAWSRDAIRRCAGKHGRKIVDLNDLMGEWQGMRHWLKPGSDVIHFLDGEHAFLLLPQLKHVAKRFGRPTGFLATFHQPPDCLKKMIRPTVASGLHRILTVSPTQNGFFSAGGIRKVTTVRHGVDTDFFSPGRQSSVGGPFTLLTVGRWMRDFDAVLKTARILKADPGFRFHLVSPGVALNKVPANVHVSSDISDAELRHLYQVSSMLFLPLHDATANNTLLEAAACGLPILTTDLPSVRFYFSESAVRLVKGNAAPEFAQTILALRRTRDQLAAMGRLALECVRSLSWRRQAAEFERIYRSVWETASRECTR